MRICIILLLNLLLLLNLNAGDKTSSLGISAGINYSNLSYDSLLSIWESSDRQKNLTYSIVFEHQFHQHLSISSGLRYTAISNKVTIDQTLYDLIPTPPELRNIYNITSHKFLAIPVLFKFYLPFLSNFYFLGGPEAGYLISSESIRKYADGSQKKEDIVKSLNRINIALNVGIGLEQRIHSYTGFISVVYSYGVGIIPQEQYWITEWTTREFYATIGLRYNL
jgi:hypothetical protein